MATGDHDGRITQALTDRLTCLGMEMAESVRDRIREWLSPDDLWDWEDE